MQRPKVAKRKTVEQEKDMANVGSVEGGVAHDGHVRCFSREWAKGNGQTQYQQSTAQGNIGKVVNEAKAKATEGKERAIMEGTGRTDIDFLGRRLAKIFVIGAGEITRPQGERDPLREIDCVKFATTQNKYIQFTEEDGDDNVGDSDIGETCGNTLGQRSKRDKSKPNKRQR